MLNHKRMKSNLLKSIKLTLLFCVFFGVCYIGVLWLFAKVAGPNSGNADVVVVDGRIVGAANVGQAFTKDIYFWGRPSVVDYNGAGSGGSNKGAINPDYLLEVQARIDTFLVKHPYLQRSEVPAEMVTASGSGLDPDISVIGAEIQVKRVATARGLSEESVRAIVEKQIEKPLLGLFGPSKVNVLKLNVALDKASTETK